MVSILQNTSNLFNVVDEGVAVLIPVSFKSVLIRELVTAELQCDLKTVAAEVVEILHTCKETGNQKRAIMMLS